MPAVEFIKQLIAVAMVNSYHSIEQSSFSHISPLQKQLDTYVTTVKQVRVLYRFMTRQCCHSSVIFVSFATH